MSLTSDKYSVQCPPDCTFSVDRVGAGIAQTLLDMRTQGAGRGTMLRRASELAGHPFPPTNMQRHLLHYKELETGPAPDLSDGKRLADLEILDLVIQRGAINSANWKPTIKDTIEAMKLKMQMTGNSAFDDLKALFDGVDADEVIAEADEALLSEAERPNEDSEDLEALPEPLL